MRVTGADVWQAHMYYGLVGTGRTQPLQIGCTRSGTASSDSVETREFLVKAVGCPEITPRQLLCEWLGNLLAQHFSIQVGKAALVHISEAFITAYRTALPRHTLVSGFAVGSEFHQGIAGIGPILLFQRPGEVSEAARLFFFDMLVQNADRKVSNANCGYWGNRLFAYDFEMCFGFSVRYSRLRNPAR